jgi:hypothetical protein
MFQSLINHHLNRKQASNKPEQAKNEAIQAVNKYTNAIATPLNEEYVSFY